MTVTPTETAAPTTGGETYSAVRALEAFVSTVSGGPVAPAELVSVVREQAAAYDAAGQPVYTDKGTYTPKFAADVAKQVRGRKRAGGGVGGGVVTGDRQKPPPGSANAPEGEIGRTMGQGINRPRGRVDYSGVLRGWGLPDTPNTRALVDQANARGYSKEQFVFWARQTPEYQEVFPGNLTMQGGLDNPPHYGDGGGGGGSGSGGSSGGDAGGGGSSGGSSGGSNSSGSTSGTTGSPQTKMSESEYKAAQNGYQTAAHSAGLNFSPKLAGWAVKNDVSVAEYSERAEAIRRLKSDADFYNAFIETLRREGTAGRGALPKDNDKTTEAMQKFVMGMGPVSWYKIMQQVITQYSAEQAGIELQRHPERSYASLRPNMIERISKKGLTEAEMAEGFGQVAEDLLNVLPEARIQGAGISKKDIVTAQFGGKNSALIKQQIARVAKNYEAGQQDYASSATGVPEGGGFGVGGNIRRNRAQGA